MDSPKRKLSSEDQLDSDNQGNTSLNINSTRSDVDSPTRSYALIESDPNELDRIIDLLRQFFPKTKILEYNQSSHTTASQQQASSGLNYSSQFLISSFESDSNNDQASRNTNSPIFKGKVKDYLQRRYLEQIVEHQPHKEILTKFRSNNINSFDSSSSSTINKPSITSKSRSLDLPSNSSQNTINAENVSIVRSQSKRGLLQHYTPIDIDDTSNDTGKITFNIDQPEDDDDEEEDDEDEEEIKSRYSFSEQQSNNKTNNFLLPYYHSFEQEQGTITSPFPSRISVPPTPYSASSDPGPFHSPWFNTPTSSFNFRFPPSKDPLHVNTQGTIAQLSTLTKMLCDEPSVFTPISPRFKTEKHDSSSVSPCQICRQEFNSHEMYLTHYRTHLENSCEHKKSDIVNSDIKCDPSSDLRNYICKICSKRFSRSDMLNRHLRLHSGVRPYRCTMCDTYFSRSDHLSTHLRTHTGEKPYTCPQCSYTACRRDMITRHSKIHMKKRSSRKNATSTFASSNDL